jgi:CheY-like chemotaxis protein
MLKPRQNLLQGAGYSLITAGSASGALRSLDEGLSVDLLLLDYPFSDMKVGEFASRVRKLRPDLRLLIFSDTKIPAVLLRMTVASMGSQPDPQALLSALGRALAEDKNAPRSAQLIVLCVEDELLQLQGRQSLFESAGYTVLGAQSGVAALQIFRSRHVDAVVMDYWLAGRNGTDVAEEMKKLRPEVPVVMLSSFSSLPGEGTVVDSWLRKAAVQPEELLAEVRRLINLRRHNPSSPA